MVTREEVVRGGVRRVGVGGGVVWDSIAQGCLGEVEKCAS